MKDKYDYKALGNRIRKIRKSRGFTQEQLAEACELSAAHIGHIERGTRALSIESLISISDVLDVSIDYLLLDIKEPKHKIPNGILCALGNTDDDKFNRFYSVFKILADNIEKL